MTKGTDFQIVSDLIYRVHGDGKVAQTFWRYLEAQAERLVDLNWPAIERVAQALLEHGTLSGDEVRTAMLPKTVSQRFRHGPRARTSRILSSVRCPQLFVFQSIHEAC